MSTHDAVTHAAVVGIGFSIVSALLLLFLYLFSLPQMSKTGISKTVCSCTLLGLAALQFFHLRVFLDGLDALARRDYCTLLMLLPLSFYAFSLYVLFPSEEKRTVLLLHLLPPIASVFLPVSVVVPLAFFIGAGYSLWLALRLFSLRERRQRFGVEIFFFAMFAVMAVVALLLGLLLPVIDVQLYYLNYSIAISLAMASVMSSLLIFPELLEDLVSVTNSPYAASKLAGIDTAEKLKQLNWQMDNARLYEDESLTLATLSEVLELSPHQLSELINTHHGVNYSRFVKRYRVEAAKRILVEEPESTILAIGMQTGFNSQSAFYAAFKDLVGVSPGQYRKQQGV